MLSIQFRHWRASLLRSLRPIFHWKFSGTVIPLLFGTGVAMALGDKVLMAHAFFLLAGVWTIGYWLTSPWLNDKRKLLASRSVRRDAKRSAKEARAYCLWEWGVCLVIVLISAAFMLWTDQQHRWHVRDEAYLGLVFSTGDERNPLDSTFTLCNKNSHDLGDHALVATPNMIVGNHGTTIIRAENSGERTGLHFACDGYTDMLNVSSCQTYLTCLHNIAMERDIDCVDVTLNLSYELKEQPHHQNRKDFRFTSGRKDGFAWHSQPPENPFNYCATYATRPTAP